MKFCQRTAVGAVVGVLAVTSLAGCSGPSFTDRFIGQIELSGGTRVTLANVIGNEDHLEAEGDKSAGDTGDKSASNLGDTGDADSFLVVCPYDSDIDERLGFAWADAPDTFASDNSQTVVVVDDGAVESSHSIAFSDIHLCSADMRELTALDEPLNFSQNAEGTWVLVD
jgi:hypothetical protein